MDQNSTLHNIKISVATIKNQKLKVQRECYVPNNNRNEDLLHNEFISGKK